MSALQTVCIADMQQTAGIPAPKTTRHSLYSSQSTGCDVITSSASSFRPINRHCCYSMLLATGRNFDDLEVKKK